MTLKARPKDRQEKVGGSVLGGQGEEGPEKVLPVEPEVWPAVRIWGPAEAVGPHRGVSLPGRSHCLFPSPPRPPVPPSAAATPRAAGAGGGRARPRPHTPPGLGNRYVPRRLRGSVLAGQVRVGSPGTRRGRSWWVPQEMGRCSSSEPVYSPRGSYL